MKQTKSQAAWNRKNRSRRREWNKRWIANNRERYNASKARYRRKLKIEAMRLYCGDPIRCQQCGFAKLDGLVMDHVEHNGAAHRKAERISSRAGIYGTNIYELIRRKGKIPGLQVLCANCNTIKHAKYNRRRTIKDLALLAEIEALYADSAS